MNDMNLCRLEGRVCLAGDFVSAFSFAPLPGTAVQAGSAVAVDGSGNVLLAGSFAGTTIDLDPSAATANLVSTSAGNLYVAKYSQAGALVWARQVRSTGTGADELAGAADVATDPAGNVYVAGEFEGPVDFDPGAGTNVLTSAAGRREQFVLKLDPAGNFVWARQIASATGDAYAGGIAVDPGGEAVVAGTGGHGPGFGFQGDVLMTKLDAAGAVAWSRHTEIVQTRLDRTVLPSEQPDVAIDPAGNVIVGGTFHGRPVFGLGEPGQTRLNGGEAGDLFTWKLTSAGDTAWARSQGANGFDGGYGVAVDAGGNVYLAGELGGWADMDPRKGQETIIRAENTNAFLSKLTPAGDLAWARQTGRRAGRSGQSYADAVAVAADGSVYTAGKIMGYIDLDPDPAAAFVIVGKNADDTPGVNFVTKLDPAGSFVYARSLAGRPHVFDDNNHLSLAVSPTDGHVLVTDTFNGVRDFNPFFRAASNRTAEREDVFLLELTG